MFLFLSTDSYYLYGHGAEHLFIGTMVPMGDHDIYQDVLIIYSITFNYLIILLAVLILRCTC